MQTNIHYLSKFLKVSTQKGKNAPKINAFRKSQLQHSLGLESDLSLGSEDLPYDILAANIHNANISEKEFIQWAKETTLFHDNNGSLNILNESAVIQILASWDSVCRIIKRKRENYVLG